LRKGQSFSFLDSSLLPWSFPEQPLFFDSPDLQHDFALASVLASFLEEQQPLALEDFIPQPDTVTPSVTTSGLTELEVPWMVVFLSSPDALVLVWALAITKAPRTSVRVRNIFFMVGVFFTMIVNNEV